MYDPWIGPDWEVDSFFSKVFLRTQATSSIIGSGQNWSQQGLESQSSVSEVWSRLKGSSPSILHTRFIFFPIQSTVLRKFWALIYLLLLFLNWPDLTWPDLTVFYLTFDLAIKHKLIDSSTVVYESHRLICWFNLCRIGRSLLVSPKSPCPQNGGIFFPPYWDPNLTCPPFVWLGAQEWMDWRWCPGFGKPPGSGLYYALLRYLSEPGASRRVFLRIKMWVLTMPVDCSSSSPKLHERIFQCFFLKRAMKILGGKKFEWEMFV